jgi:signal transduction histidine kinase
MPRVSVSIRRLKSNPILVDTALAVLTAGLTLQLAHGSYPTSGPRRYDTVAVLLTLLASAPLAVRRRAPVAALVACEVALLAYEAGGYWPVLNRLGPQIALVTLASRRPRRWTVAGAALIAPGELYGNIHTWNGSAFDAVTISAAYIAALCLIGERLQQLAGYRVVVADNAGRLRGEQHDREQRAVLDERVRIARELHDVVAHHMSVIAVQANLARYVLASDHATAERALRTVAEMSSEGLDEVRRLVTILRPDSEPDSTEQQTPGIDELPVMIERVGLAGVPIEFTISGEVQPLPAGVGLCVYRVVQESLTNVIKHARGAQVKVSLHYAPHQITTRITDDGGVAPADERADHPGEGGKGLTGMYERAMLYRGKLTAGELPQGGFEVVLTLPIHPVAEHRRPVPSENSRGQR